jgi:hypothetical protein
MKIKLSVCIVTFKQRKELIKDLVGKIKNRFPESVDILLAINGNNEEDMPDDYRIEMLDLAKSHKNVYPIFCPEFKSLPKLWNTLLIFSKTEYNLILCDDVEFLNSNAYDEIINYIDQTKTQFFTLNYGFSHFVCSKTIIHQLGYFDERLLAFGEEDGDMHYRHIKMFGHRIPMFMISGIYNKATYNLSSANLDVHQDNKPRVNREIFSHMYKENNDEGITTPLCPIKIKKVCIDVPQYPYEEFVRKNKHNIIKFDKIIFE